MSASVQHVIGSLGGKPLIIVSLTRAAMQRVRELTLVGAAPTWIEHDAGANVERIATTDPEWFAELDRKVRSTT